MSKGKVNSKTKSKVNIDKQFRTHNGLSYNGDKSLVLTKIDRLKQYGRIELTTQEDLESNFQVGSMVDYMNHQNIYKAAGFITAFGDDYFDFITYDFEKKYRLRYKFITKMWVGSVYSTVGDVVSITTTTQKKKKVATKVDGIIVHYADKPSGAFKFKHTEKYRRMIKWLEYFKGKTEDEDNED